MDMEAVWAYILVPEKLISKLIKVISVIQWKYSWLNKPTLYMNCQVYPAQIRYLPLLYGSKQAR